MKSNFIKCLAIAALSAFATPAFAVRWEKQAGRLQRVSASLLDDVPVAEPIPSSAASIFTTVSFLPTVSSTVGGKTEQAPSSPIHAVPKIGYDLNVQMLETVNVGGGLYAGYLPSGSEKLIGVTAAIQQGVIGGHLGASYDVSDHFTLWGQIGYQYSSASVTGGITSPTANDRFAISSSLVTASVVGDYRGFFGGLLLGLKDTTSKFQIPSDGTTFSLEDQLEDSALPLLAQFTVGYKHASGFKAALSELAVPNRLYMPRITVGFEYLFDSSPSAPVAAPVPVAAPKPMPAAARPQELTKTPQATPDDSTEEVEHLYYDPSKFRIRVEEDSQ